MFGGIWGLLCTLGLLRVLASLFVMVPSFAMPPPYELTRTRGTGCLSRALQTDGVIKEFAGVGDHGMKQEAGALEGCLTCLCSSD